MREWGWGDAGFALVDNVVEASAVIVSAVLEAVIIVRAAIVHPIIKSALVCSVRGISSAHGLIWLNIAAVSPESMARWTAGRSRRIRLGW
jgi:hypothetical protein